jgi:dUTP pyrophosphatase
MTNDNTPMVSVRVRLLRANALLPDRATTGATGLDLRACFDDPEETVTIGVDPVLVPTGIAIEVPAGFDAQVRPRSGLTRRGVIVQLGTIDADYRGEVFVTMYIVGTREPHVATHGDRIAQLVIAPLASSVLVNVDDLSATERGTGGHGSTGD